MSTPPPSRFRCAPAERDGGAAKAASKLFVRALGHDALVRHYHGLAHRQYARHVGQRETVNLKKYFYVIRPTVALLWLRQRPGDVPLMSLPDLLDGVDLPADVVREIASQRSRKLGRGEARLARGSLHSMPSAKRKWNGRASVCRRSGVV